MIEVSLCTFSDNFQIFDVTPVENLFILEFMLKAPGDFVKVYLYGLKQCYHPHDSENSLEAFSHALGLEKAVVQNAFQYWSRQGVLSFSEDQEHGLQIQYHNIKDVLYNRGLNTEKDLYKYKDFNHNLQQVFDTRLLTPQEYMRIYDWIETLNLPMEVVLMMIRFYITKMGSKATINYLDKVAESWAKDGINTLQKAEEFIESTDATFKDTCAVLKYLGIHRTPSKAELDLYRKWQQWGYSLNAILAACRETTKIQSPNMGYLDKIVSSLNKLGLHSTQEISQYFKIRDSSQDKIKEVLFQLGCKDVSPTPEHAAMYRHWVEECSLDHSVILLACRQCARKKSHTFEDLDNLLKAWAQNGLTSQDEIRSYLSKRKALDNEIRAVLERAGESRGITPADRRLYKQWLEDWKISFELVLLAAEYSEMAENKLPFINKILSSWHSRGITTLEEARADHEQHLLGKGQETASPAKGLKKQLDFNKFPQRNYSEEELEHLFESFET